MGRMKIKAGATFGNGEALTDEQQQQLQRQVDESSIFRAERWEDGRPAPEPAAPAAPAPAAPQPDAQGFYATSLIEFKQLYHDLLPRHIRQDNGEHYANSTIKQPTSRPSTTPSWRRTSTSPTASAPTTTSRSPRAWSTSCASPTTCPTATTTRGGTGRMRTSAAPLRPQQQPPHQRRRCDLRGLQAPAAQRGRLADADLQVLRRAAPAVGAHVGLDAE